jgi:hypothetical protein
LLETDARESIFATSQETITVLTEFLGGCFDANALKIVERFALKPGWTGLVGTGVHTTTTRFEGFAL